MNTMLCQLKSLLLLGVLLFANGAFGQPMIWDDTSPETIVFELTNKEALKLLKGKLRQKQWDKIQQTPFLPVSRILGAILRSKGIFCWLM